MARDNNAEDVARVSASASAGAGASLRASPSCSYRMKSVDSRVLDRSFRPMNRKKGRKAESLARFEDIIYPVEKKVTRNRVTFSNHRHRRSPLQSPVPLQPSSARLRSLFGCSPSSVHRSSFSRKEARLRKGNGAETAQMTREFSTDEISRCLCLCLIGGRRRKSS